MYMLLNNLLFAKQYYAMDQNCKMIDVEIMTSLCQIFVTLEPTVRPLMTSYFY